MSAVPGRSDVATQRVRVLVVDDESMIRMLIEDMLSELGHTLAAQAGRIDEALDAVENVAFDVAILDINLSGQIVVPVAEALAARGVPFAFITGYGDVSLPEGFRDRPTLQKPFKKDDLGHTLALALGAAGHRISGTAPSAGS